MAANEHHAHSSGLPSALTHALSGEPSPPFSFSASIHWAGGWLHPQGQGPALRKLLLRGTLPCAVLVAGAKK